ncbi:MAG: YciI family protein [Amphiplicatus sp.]
MQYALLLYDNEDAWDTASEAEQGEVIGAHMAYTQALRDAGAYVGGEPLDHSRAAKAVRMRAGRVSVEDGPFTDSKEQLGGFYIIEAKDLDAALDWAARCPSSSYGQIELRPVLTIPADA